MSWRSVSAFDGGDNAAPAHIGPHLSRQWATHCTFGQPLRTFHSCRSAHEDNTGRRTAQKSALDVGEPATQCTGEGGRAVHGQGERRAHQFLHLALCSARWLLGHPPYFASRCKAGSLMCDRRTASCRHLRACRSIPPASLRARLATLDTPDDPARSARASARGASGARAAASNHWRLQLQQRAAARSIDLMGAAKNQKEAGG